jgi:hypothetical protein
MRISRNRSCSPNRAMLRSAGVKVSSSTTVSVSGPAQVARADVGPRPNWLLNTRTISFEISVSDDLSGSGWS